MWDLASESSRSGMFRRLISGPNIVDLTLALAVITLITGLAIPYFFSKPEITLDHAAILLANDLRYAQNEAAICGRETRVMFAGDGDGYQVRYRDGGAVANPVGGADLRRIYSIDAIFRGVRIEPLGEIEGVDFDRNGFAQSGLEVELTYEDGRRLLTMEKGSGLIHIAGLESDWRDDGL
jgi:hypothetical protein